MKKIAALFLAVLMISLLLVACKPDAVVDPTDDPAEPTDDPAEPTDDPVEPTDDPVEPTDDPVEPTEDTDEPTEDTDEPTQPEESAEPAAKINFFDISKATQGYWEESGRFVASLNFYSSELLEVSEGDVITFGAAVKSQGWHITLFDSTNECIGIATLSKGISVVSTLDDGGVILSYKIGAGVASIRMVCDAKYADVYRVTINDPFDKSGYGEQFSAPSDKKFKNLFDKASLTVGYVNTTTSNGTTAFRTSAPIAVKADDVITFGAAVSSQGWHLVTYDADMAPLTEGKLSTGVMIAARLDTETAIMKYQVSEGTAYVRMVADAKYLDQYLVTLNDPFSVTDYYDFFDQNGNAHPKEDGASDSAVNKDTVLYGKSALYCGDSISYGYCDTIKGEGWAARLEAQYGLKADNRSQSGWCLSSVRSKYNRISSQLRSAKTGSFDVIVLEGGVNDAWGKTDNSGIVAPVGVMSDSYCVEDFDVSTFAGGLEELFYYADEYFPDAVVVYVSMFYMPKADKSTNLVCDMEEYYAMAEQICDKWAVEYLDLYHNEELSQALRVNEGRNEFLRDAIHPSGLGYDVITPYIAEFLLKVVK